MESSHKIDISYLGRTINKTNKLKDLSKIYKVGVVFDDSIYKFLSNGMRKYVRPIDKIIFKGEDQENYIYTIDIITKDLYTIREIKEKSTNINQFRDEFPKTWTKFIKDKEFIESRKKYTKEFYECFCSAFKNYVEGNWINAKLGFETCQTIYGNDENVCKILLDYIKSCNNIYRGIKIIN